MEKRRRTPVGPPAKNADATIRLAAFAARQGTDVSFDVLQHIETERNINGILKDIRDYFALKHVTVVVARYGKEPERDPFVRTTYPTAWAGRYLLKRYWRIDPIMQAGFMRVIPFDWREIDRTDPKIDAFFQDAARHNVGVNGYCIPLTNKHQQRGIMSVSANLVGADWEAFKRLHLADWLEIGPSLHQRCIRELFGDEAPPPRLSPREKEVLAWVGQGKEVPDIAIITDLSEHTVRTYLKSARLKLNCGTLTHAAVKAERLGILEADPTQI